MTVNTIGVVGAGMMGSEIALVMALAGKSVLLSDRDQPLLDGALAKLEAVLDKGIARGFYSADDKARALANLQTTLDLGDFAPCDMVIEAVFEDEKVKAGRLSGARRGSGGRMPDREQHVEHLDQRARLLSGGGAAALLPRHPFLLAGLAHEAG